jgi:hypothetical protein
VTITRRRPPAGAFTFFAILGALVCAPTLPAQTGAVVARAASVAGQAVLLSGGGAPLLLTSGYILSPGDRVDTRGGGRVVIDLSDGSMVVVAPESVVTLKDYRTAGSLRELFEITLGAVRVKINHFAGKPNPYRMNSPTASIAVRGTEFTVTVSETGDTEVDVIEGLVEVTQRNDPSRSVLLEAGRGVLIQAGQNLRLIGANPGPPGNRDAADRDGGPPKPPQQQAAANQPRNGPGPPGGGNSQGPQAPKEPDGQQRPMAVQGGNQAKNEGPEHDDHSPRSTASTYDRYLAGLANIGQVPFLLRFNAFREAHLDSLENPAYAGQFRQAEGRLLFLPTFRGTRTLQEYQSAFGPGGTLPGGYSVSPEVSYFAPAGAYSFGGSASYSRIGDNAGSSSSSTNYFSGALVAARRVGRSSFGIELASLKGTGASSASDGPETFSGESDVTQTRLTAGFSRDLGRNTTLGVFYRYGFIDAGDRELIHAAPGRPTGLNATSTAGHSSEAGIRLRGQLSARLYYGVTAAWLGISLGGGMDRTNAVPSQARDRAQRGSLAFGLGYAVTDRTSLTFDWAGGTGRTSAARNENSTGALLQNGVDRSRFASFHMAAQHDLTRGIFFSASLLQVWQSHRCNVDLFPDRFGARTPVDDSFFALSTAPPYAARFSDFGAGWRFSRNLYAQYVFSTDYGANSATHTLMLRWTFHPKER